MSFPLIAGTVGYVGAGYFVHTIYSEDRRIRSPLISAIHLPELDYEQLYTPLTVKAG